MTKKQMKEKYTIVLGDASSRIQFYKDCIMTVVNAYCTIEEIGELSLRKLVFTTLARSQNKEHIEDLMRNWGYLEKAKREATIVTEFLTDLH